jgi:hypothetical protein
MNKPFDHYAEQQKRKAEQLEAQIRADERERIITLIGAKDEWHYAFSDVSDIIALIKGENE